MMQNETIDAQAFVGRQPIFSADVKTKAYELLFRSSHENRAQFLDGEQATADLIVNSFADIGIGRIAGELPTFINVSENFLVGEHALALPASKVVLEILEDVPPTQPVLDALKELKKLGYRFAIDDFVYAPGLLPLVELADIIKIELPAVSPQELPEHVKTLRQYNVQLLAEKVETRSDFEMCKRLNFDLYQGYFFCQPKIIEGRKLPINRVAIVRLIARLKDPAIELEELAAIVRTEPTLSFRILRYVNSVCNGLTSKVESIQHALAMAGVHRIKSLCCLSLIADMTRAKPAQLFHTILIRARMAELLAQQLKQANTDAFFLTGLFSAIDALLDAPMNEIMEMVPVSDEVKAALTQGVGLQGDVLQCVLAYEQGDWERVHCESLSAETIRNAYLESIEWAEAAASDTPEY